MDTRNSLRGGVGLAAGAAGAGVAVVLVVRAARSALRAAPRALPSGDGRRSYLRGVTVNRTPDDVYAFWRDLPGLAGVLDRVVAVEPVDDHRSQWTVQGPGGGELRFVAEIVVDEPGRAIAWRSVDSPVPHEGRVEFQPAPGGRGTELRIALSYAPPAGALGAAVARLTGDEPDLLLRDALRRVKQVLECGEVVRVDGQPSGRGPVQAKLTEALRHKVATGGRA